MHADRSGTVLVHSGPQPVALGREHQCFPDRDIPAYRGGVGRFAGVDRRLLGRPSAAAYAVIQLVLCLLPSLHRPLFNRAHRPSRLLEEDTAAWFWSGVDWASLSSDLSR